MRESDDTLALFPDVEPGRLVAPGSTSPRCAPEGGAAHLPHEPSVERLTLSVQQPWAWLLVHGFKPLENRSWSSRFRGVLNIHAGKRIDREGWDWVRQQFPEIPIPDQLEVGGVVGTVLQTGCVTTHPSPWFFGPFGHVMTAGEPCALRSCRGTLGYFRAAGPVRRDGRRE